MTPRINLAALTEAELLSLYGPQEASARLPEITRARLENRAVPGDELSATLLESVAEVPERAWGATPEQSRTLNTRHAELIALSAQEQGIWALGGRPQQFARAYSLGETALLLRWDESRREEPQLFLLTWLRDRASGLACVLTSDSPQATAPAQSEEIDLHQHPGAAVGELLDIHRQQVARLGKPQKLSAGGACGAWQAAHDLNLAAWRRRGVVVGE